MEKTDEVTAQDPRSAVSSSILETGPASSQDGLPSGVVLEIVQYLDLHSLLKCRLVCSDFQSLIDSTASVQYQIELAVAGQQDGSYGDMFTRREMLKVHQKGWDRLQWTEVLRVPRMVTDRYHKDFRWGLYGGVLAQAPYRPKPYTLHLKRLPSKSRGIKEKNWILDLSTLLEEDRRGFGGFGMDPGQDLLVVIMLARSDNRLRIHLLTLSMGERHPFASEPCLVAHPLFPGVWGVKWFHINIRHDFLGIHAIAGVMVWNWKTGQVLMHIVDNHITSMVLLNERYVLMAVKGLSEPLLLAVDFLAEPPEQRGLYEQENYFTFRFPVTFDWYSGIVVRSNPCSTWGPDTDPPVPFSMVPQSRLCVVHLSEIHDANNNDQLGYLGFAILEVSFLSLIQTGLRVNNHFFHWSMWGPEHCRTFKLPIDLYFYGDIWPLTSHGTRLAIPRNSPHRGVLIDIYDFNQLGCRNKKQDSDVETPGNVNVSESNEIIEGPPVCVLGPTRIKPDILGPTRLGYSVTSWPVSGKTDARSISAVCSEDAVVIMDKDNSMYEIYTV